MSYITVFYAGLVLEELPTYREFELFRVRSNPEVYNGAFVYFSKTSEKRHWYRMDGTPVLDADVPLNLKTWVLLL